MDNKSKAFIAKLVEELEKTQETLANQEKLYINSKLLLESERSEVEALRLEVDQAESVITTLKEDLAASQAQCNSLKMRNEELEEQYSLLWSSTSHPSKAKVDSSTSTSKGCERCYKIDVDAYATNLANMEAMKKEIARLTSLIAMGHSSDEAKSKGTKSMKGKQVQIKTNGFGYVEGEKINGRKIIKNKECVKFDSKGVLFGQTSEVPGSTSGGSETKPVKQTAQTSEVPKKTSEVPKKGWLNQVLKKRGIKSQPAEPAVKTHSSKAKSTHEEIKNNPFIPKRSKYSHKHKAQASSEEPPSYVLRRNNLGKVVATYVGAQSNIYVKRSLWVPKILVANVEGPNSTWGPKRRN